MKRLLVIILVFAGVLWPQTSEYKYHYQAPINCAECHECAKPTYKNPCLKILPDFRREGITLQASATDVPELIIIDTLANLYEPSIFTHKLHAEMAEMAGGCAYCHHHNPPGRILRCVECHEPSKQRQDLSKPGLAGAYHQQCQACHREWSHQTNCTVCHAQKGQGQESDKTRFLGVSHKKTETPKKIVMQTEYEEQPVVTFYHEAHNKQYGYKCKDCHQEESCSRCHDTMKKTGAKEKEPHDNCMKCHERDIDNNCEKCHDVKEKPGFDHASVGWPLNRSHQNLSCVACHTTGKFTRLNKNCTACHREFKSGSFNHEVTGLILDDFHSELDCSDCHAGNNFSKPASCADCHEDYKYPKMKPGRTKK